MKPAMSKLAVAAFAAVALWGAQAAAQELREIRISSQPALLGSVPFTVAEENNMWREVGLRVTITNFPAGAPQIAASRSWDLGYTGAVPAVLGAARFDLHTFAFSDDQSATNGIWVNGPQAAAIVANPPSLRGQTIFLTANSTVDLAVRACVQRFGLARGDVTLRSMGQSEIIAAMSSGSANLGGLWAPNIYTVEEQAGARALCSGRDVNVMIPGNMIVRADWARDNPELLARFLAVYLRAQRWLAADRPRAIEAMRRHYAAGGVNISAAAMNREFELRPMYDLAGQLGLFARTGGQPSQADKTMDEIAKFMKEVGSLRADEALPNVATYVTDAALRRIDGDARLKAFANLAN
jgi:sulfonate transport system substrate-binding protein